MRDKTAMKSLALTLGTTFTGSLAGQAVAAEANPFALSDLGQGYMVADAQGEGRCGEGKCGGAMQKEMAQEGKCGEGKCGAAMQKEMAQEGKCGEGKCGAAMQQEKAQEGKCGGNR